jgi:hypothetical protein
VRASGNATSSVGGTAELAARTAIVDDGSPAGFGRAVPAPLEIRLAPAVASMAAAIEPHRPWLESVLGCVLGETVTLEVGMPFGQFAAGALLDGVPLDRGCLEQAAALAPIVVRWAVPPGVSPRIELQASRMRGVPLSEREPAWDPHWKDTPVALWLRGLVHAAVAIDIPHVSFAGGLKASSRDCLLVNRREVGPLLTLLRGYVFQPRTVITVGNGLDIPLPPTRYDWDTLTLDPHVAGLVRDDFEGFLGRESWFRDHGFPFRRGYLLYGPPGNGKTSVIRVMSSHPAMTAFALNFSDENADDGTLSSLFEAAGRNAPSLVIFEDLDRLFGRSVDPPNPHNRTRITFQHLLGCLDGLGSQDGVIVVATANDPTALDTAILRRPGRFDRVVVFPRPSFALRVAYLQRLAPGTLGSEVVQRAAAATDGFSFAQLREAYIAAGRGAFRRSEQLVTAADLFEGIELVRGETRGSRERTDGLAAGFAATRGDSGHAVDVGAES